MISVNIRAALLATGLVALQVRAQLVPAPPDVRLEDFLIEVGRQYGIVVHLDETLADHVVLSPRGESVESALKNSLTRYSYLLVYSGPFSGLISASPNRLYVFSPDAEQAAWQPMAVSTLADPIEQIDEILKSSNENPATTAARLASVLESSGSIALREEAVYALAQIDAEFSRSALVRALNDESPVIREAAVIAIADNGYADARRLLNSKLGDRSEAVRTASMEALAQLD